MSVIPEGFQCQGVSMIFQHATLVRKSVSLYGSTLSASVLTFKLSLSMLLSFISKSVYSYECRCHVVGIYYFILNIVSACAGLYAYLIITEYLTDLESWIFILFSISLNATSLS